MRTPGAAAMISPVSVMPSMPACARPSAPSFRPGQDGEARPLLAPSRGLGLVDVSGCEHRVGSRHEIEHVSQPVRSVDTPLAIGLQTDAEAGGGCLERVDRRLGGLMRAARDAELPLI